MLVFRMFLRSALVGIALIACASALSAAEKPASARLAIAALDFVPRNVDAGSAAQLASIVRRALRAERDFAVPDDAAVYEVQRAAGFGRAACDAEDCAAAQGAFLSSEKIVVGRLTRYTEKTGEEQVSEYVVRDQYRESFVVEVKAIDVKTGAADLSRTETAPTLAEARAKTERIAREIVELYRKLLADRARERAFGIELDGVSLTLALLRPVGIMADMAGGGYGAVVGLNARLLPGRRALAMVSLGYFVMDDDRASIRSYALSSAILGAGYRFTPYGPLFVIPHAGFGCMLHLIDGDPNGADAAGRYSYRMRYLFDPAFVAGCEIGVLPLENLAIFISPFCGLFFQQKSNAGQFLGLGLGARYLF